MDYEKLGRFIRKKRKEKGLTQEQLAQKAGLSRQTLSRIENGYIARVTVIQMEAILRQLGYDLCITPWNPFSKEEPFMCKEDWDTDEI